MESTHDQGAEATQPVSQDTPVLQVPEEIPTESIPVATPVDKTTKPSNKDTHNPPKQIDNRIKIRTFLSKERFEKEFGQTYSPKIMDGTKDHPLADTARTIATAAGISCAPPGSLIVDISGSMRTIKLLKANSKHFQFKNKKAVVLRAPSKVEALTPKDTERRVGGPKEGVYDHDDVDRLIKDNEFYTPVPPSTKNKSKKKEPSDDQVPDTIPRPRVGLLIDIYQDDRQATFELADKMGLEYVEVVCLTFHDSHGSSFGGENTWYVDENSQIIHKTGDEPKYVSHTVSDQNQLLFEHYICPDGHAVYSGYFLKKQKDYSVIRYKRSVLHTGFKFPFSDYYRLDRTVTMDKVGQFLERVSWASVAGVSDRTGVVIRPLYEMLTERFGRAAASASRDLTMSRTLHAEFQKNPGMKLWKTTTDSTTRERVIADTIEYAVCNNRAFRKRAIARLDRWIDKYIVAIEGVLTLLSGIFDVSWSIADLKSCIHAGILAAQVIYDHGPAAIMNAETVICHYLNLEPDDAVTRAPPNCYAKVTVAQPLDLKTISESTDRIALMRPMSVSPNASSLSDEDYNIATQDLALTMGRFPGRYTMAWIPNMYGLPASDTGSLFNKTFPAVMPAYMSSKQKTQKIGIAYKRWTKAITIDYNHLEQLTFTEQVTNMTGYRKLRGQRMLDQFEHLQLSLDQIVHLYATYKLMPKSDEANPAKILLGDSTTLLVNESDLDAPEPLPFTAEQEGVIEAKVRGIFFVDPAWSLIEGEWGQVAGIWTQQVQEKNFTLTARVSGRGEICLDYAICPEIKSSPVEIARHQADYDQILGPKAISFHVGDDWTYKMSFRYPATQFRVRLGAEIDAVGMDQSQDLPHQEMYWRHLTDGNLDEAAKINELYQSYCNGRVFLKSGLSEKTSIKLTRAFRVFSGSKWTTHKNTHAMTVYANDALSEILANLLAPDALLSWAQKEGIIRESMADSMSEEDIFSKAASAFIFIQIKKRFNALGMDTTGRYESGDGVDSLSFLRCLWYPTTDYEVPYVFARAPSAFRTLGSFNSSPLSCIRRGIRKPNIASRMILGGMHQAHKHFPRNTPLFGKYFAKCKEIGLPINYVSLQKLYPREVDKPWTDYSSHHEYLESFGETLVDEIAVAEILKHRYNLTDVDFEGFYEELELMTIDAPCRVFKRQVWLEKMCIVDYGPLKVRFDESLSASESPSDSDEDPFCRWDDLETSTP